MGNQNLTPSITHKYPTYRDAILKTGHTWLAGRRKDENAEGLWRIHDKLYDLTNFVDIHPGGEDWLKLTKGCDITEAFESHHISVKPEKLLQYYFVRNASKPRNSKLTFAEDGFYKTLKRRVAAKMPAVNKNRRRDERKSKFIQDSLLLLTLVMAGLVGRFPNSWALIILAGIVMTGTIITAHNFFHKRDNWRMKIFNLCLMSFREWRISHVLSHHQFPNSLSDLEVSFMEPFLMHSVYPKKNFVQRYGSWAYEWLIYSVIYSNEAIKRTIMSIVFRKNYWHLDEILIPLVVPTTIYLFGGPNLTILASFKLWFWILTAASAFFGLITINAAHHPLGAFHEGDPVRDDMDFGVFQLDSVVERDGLKKSLLLVLTHFGDHGMHHLFPTLDHAILPHFNDIFVKTCEEFGLEPQRSDWFELFKEQHLQLARTKPKKCPIGSNIDTNKNVMK
ncbi:cytochrome b5-related protein-like [Culicoides brevitarsis]|uniref:cytochrome b5-related protein-like n=1 Tax=Culicoides brevitarsis TaxID=469753 RepID=UPI00307CBFB7